MFRYINNNIRKTNDGLVNVIDYGEYFGLWPNCDHAESVYKSISTEKEPG